MNSFILRFGFALWDKVELLAAAGVNDAVEVLKDNLSVMGHKFRVDVTLTREA